MADEYRTQRTARTPPVSAVRTRDAAVVLGRDAHPKDDVAVSGRDAVTARHDAAIAKRAAAIGFDRNRAERSHRVVNERIAVQERNPRDAQARMMHEQAVNRAAVRVQPTARGHEAPRISAAAAARPAVPHMAQPNVSHGSPMNAHAQMPAQRPAAPATAMPHLGGGGAQHVDAAPHGGGPAGGHEKH